jgi:ssDNA thymidine ADP-ribosyltransferase, DarT
VPISPSHKRRCAYHFTHIDNLSSLLQAGFLANNHPKFPKDGHRSVAARGIQERRSSMVVSCGPGGCVHDYVPLYFGAISPMLLGVINTKNVEQRDAYPTPAPCTEASFMARHPACDTM